MKRRKRICKKGENRKESKEAKERRGPAGGILGVEVQCL
jgi:hypothetical protein